MDLRHLRALVTVADESNFTRAAARLGITQPPLSRQIRELEADAGIALFDRSSRPVKLTQAGHLFYGQAVQILAGFDRLSHTMRGLGRSRPRYVVGVVGSIMHGILPEMIRQFRARVVEIDVELVELTTVEQIAALKSGRIDAGLGRVRIDDPTIQREILYDEPLMAALSLGDTLASDEMVSLANLTSGKLIIYPGQPRPSYADQLLGILRAHGCAPETVIEVREVQTALGLVATGFGRSIVPTSVQDMYRKEVVYRPILENPVSPVILSQRLNDESPLSAEFRSIGKEMSLSDYAT